MIKHHFFIAGTDTGVGKTFATAALLYKLGSMGLKTLGLKPIASGYEMLDGVYQNEDVVMLKRYSSVEISDELRTPYQFQEPIAPHVAAQKAQVNMSISTLLEAYEKAQQTPANALIIEGVGGFMVPINDEQTTADLAQAYNQPVILVVGLRLGCINHALLSVDAIRAKGLVLKGWIANHIDPNMSHYEQTLDTLKKRMGAPCLGYLPTYSVVDDLAVSAAAQCLNVEPLLTV